MRRRGFLKALLAAPVIITTPGLLMPVKRLILPPPAVVLPPITLQEIVRGSFPSARSFAEEWAARFMAIDLKTHPEPIDWLDSADAA